MSETLTLPKLTREDDGSVFECTAANYVGLAQVTAQVTVLCKFYINYCKFVEHTLLVCTLKKLHRLVQMLLQFIFLLVEPLIMLCSVMVLTVMV